MVKPSLDKSIDEEQNLAIERRSKGEFVRGISQIRNVLGTTNFPAEPNRYHLFVAFNCPWSHRVTLARNMLGLQRSITLDVAFPNRTGEEDPDGSNFWQFAPERIAAITGAPLPECTAETGTGQAFRLLREVYLAQGSDEASVPVLYDKKLNRIVSNESAGIVRMMNECSEPLGSSINSHNRVNLYPNDKKLRPEINTLNEYIYITINNGAYKAGFSSDQIIYQKAFLAYFNSLAELNNRLSDGRSFLTGEIFTEADLRLFPTIYRHDPIYYIRMKLNGAKITNFPNLWKWLCRVYAIPGVSSSSSLDHCRQGYFGRSWNNIIPIGPLYPFAYPEAYDHPELVN